MSEKMNALEAAWERARHRRMDGLYKRVSEFVAEYFELDSDEQAGCEDELYEYWDSVIADEFDRIRTLFRAIEKLYPDDKRIALLVDEVFWG